jgi:acetate kinase
VLALGVFAHRAARLIGGLATSLHRLDALVFTGGIGENSVNVRESIVSHLGILGLNLDIQANQAAVRGQCGRIDAGKGPAIWVIPTDEEGLIASDAARIAGFAQVGSPSRISPSLEESARS